MRSTQDCWATQPFKQKDSNTGIKSRKGVQVIKSDFLSMHSVKALNLLIVAKCLACMLSNLSWETPNQETPGRNTRMQKILNARAAVSVLHKD
jgi:hypothetical protein